NAMGEGCGRPTKRPTLRTKSQCSLPESGLRFGRLWQYSRLRSAHHQFLFAPLGRGQAICRVTAAAATIPMLSFSWPKIRACVDRHGLFDAAAPYAAQRSKAHGFRATFKTWASERTSFHDEIAEAALAHVIGDKVEQAYRRGDLFEKRRRLMQQWATFCTSAPMQKSQTNVTPLRAS